VRRVSCKEKQRSLPEAITASGAPWRCFMRAKARRLPSHACPKNGAMLKRHSARSPVGGQCRIFPGDLTDKRYCTELVENTVRELGALDILVSNAAHQSRKDKLEDVTDEEIELTFDTNIFAYMRLARSALKHMKPGACIIATSSETGIMGSEKLPDYSGTKGAINAFTKALAQALIARGIRANVVAPGPVWTPLNPSDPGLPPEGVANFGKKSPMGRPAQPEELAPAYVFLASNADSSYITGIVLQVMGGETTGG